MKSGIPAFLLLENKSEILIPNSRKSSLPFIDKTLKAVANTLKVIYVQSAVASKKNLFFRINPLVRVFSFVFLIVSISIGGSIKTQLLALLFVVIFYLISGVPYKYIYKKVLFLSIVFGLLIFLPASLNILTPGNIILNIITLQRPYHFWMYNIPQNIGITDAGLMTVTLLFLRVLNSISITMLFVYSSSFSNIMKGFKVFLVPDIFLMIVSLAYKFIFILSKTIEDTYFALKSRLIGSVKNNNIRKIISGRVFFIFNKSRINYEATYLAMISRGYNGKITLRYDKKIALPDIIFFLIMLSAGLLIIFIEVLWKILSI